jgi:prevent-host-death family protein
MPAATSVSVSELKNKLLEVARRVERGETFEVTKAGKPVAVLAPRGGVSRPVTGFARVEIHGSLDLPPRPRTFDVENLPKRRRSSR